MSDHKPALVPGYPRLAGRICCQPEFGIYRSFAALNARDLLYMQAEIIALEDELLKIEQEDSRSTEDNRSYFSADWYWLAKGPQTTRIDEGYDSHMQQKILCQLRPLLRDYSEFRR